MIHSEDILRFFKPNHSKWILTFIFFFFYPLEWSWGKLMLFMMTDLINRFFTGQFFVFWIWTYALFFSYLLSCIVFGLFTYILNKIEKKPEHPLARLEEQNL
ncbi:hypothetical protein J4457_03680 [Candidatus Woesearchaeota archaeon]|nr:hypothetical protein [Candidatus Woesearchaeota archaeon]